MVRDVRTGVRVMSLLCGLNNHVVGEGPLSVSPSSSSVNKEDSVSRVWALLEYKTDGIEYENSNPGTQTTNQSRGNWLDSGDVSEVWVERTIDVGSLDVDAGAGRLQLDSNRKFGLYADQIDVQSATVTFKFYDAAVDGNLLDQVSIEFTANAN